MNPQQLYHSVSHELYSILDYWISHTIDHNYGGFYGKVDHGNIVFETAPKGAVLNARILWTFSAAYNFTKDEQYLHIATRAFEYLKTCFIDKTYGGVFWSVTYEGNKLDDKKQIYALAFCIYGLAEYRQATGNDEALNIALELYNVIEKYSYDHEYKGYLEAFTRNWKNAGDLRLSEKDANEKKTMNTHLHIIEAYANLYKVFPFEKLEKSIAALLDLFSRYFIDHSTFHLKLFFDEKWNEKPDVISFGHDIEAAWLLLQCADIIGSGKWVRLFREYAVKIADAAAEGLDKDGGLWYEYDPGSGKTVKEKHWWPQGEALVGFYNAYEISGNEKYLQLAINSWKFIEAHIIDKERGEWVWGVREDYSFMFNEDKAGLWKCPYHNSRACIEILKRVQK